MNGVLAHAKVNLALVVGPLRVDGKHEVVTLLQRVDLGDAVSVEPAEELDVLGFDDDTIVRAALAALAEAAGVDPCWCARIQKTIPVAAGLGGGSSNAASALLLANGLLVEPLPAGRLEAIAAAIGADVPFFLQSGPQLGTGDGSTLEPVALPQEFWVTLVLPDGIQKLSTADVYRRFDERQGATGFEQRRQALLEGVGAIRSAEDLAALPPNDLADSVSLRS